METRDLTWDDAADVQRLRALLFPDEDVGEDWELIDYLHGDGRLIGAFVDDALVGYAACQVRSHAEGAWDRPADEQRIVYLEEWFVDEDHRGRGVGRALVDAVREWARKTRSTHLASDTLVDNEVSRAAHLALGFEEVETAIHFVERLPEPDPPPAPPADAEVTLRPVDEQTGPAVLRLRVAPSQSGFVAPNIRSLAQASFSSDVWMRAICVGDLVVGFVLVSTKPDRHYLWRLMVDRHHQGRGYGRRAVEEIVAMSREAGVDALFVSYVPGEHGPAGFYRGFGFEPTGTMHGSEVEARLDLTS